MFSFGKRVQELQSKLWSLEIYEIHPPSFSCKQTTLSKPCCGHVITLLWSGPGMSLFSSSQVLVATLTFLVENCKK